VPPTSRDPLANTDRLLVDGTNLLHALSRRGGSGSAPPTALVGRLRAMVPASIGIEVVLDGAPERGMRGERVAAGVIVRHSGRRSADDLLLGLLDEVRAVAGAPASARILVITDDRALRTALHERGARTAGSAWLLERLERPRLAASSVGNRRPPAAASEPDLDADPRPGWRPGRGATTKRGNPRRGKPSSGTMPR
jgi:hypothetical protein